jgi:hypothetical protein
MSLACLRSSCRLEITFAVGDMDKSQLDEEGNEQRALKSILDNKQTSKLGLKPVSNVMRDTILKSNKILSRSRPRA